MFNPPDYSAQKNFLHPKLGPWTVGLYIHRKKILNSLIKATPYLKGKLLDVGCGNKPYQSILSTDQYTGIDVNVTLHQKDNVDVMFDGVNIPFDNDHFNSVLCTEVLEHCADPVVLMKEIKRILKPGGCAFITAPMFIEHHEVPYDMRRMTYYGMKNLAESNGMEIIMIEDRGSFFAVLTSAVCMAVGQLISRRPFSDIVNWILFPFLLLLIKIDWVRKKNPPVISLGWQMLVKKSV